MLQKLAKPLFIRNFIYFVPKSSLKTKEQNRKKSIPWSLLLYLSKHKFLVKIVMFLKQHVVNKGNFLQCLLFFHFHFHLTNYHIIIQKKLLFVLLSLSRGLLFSIWTNKPVSKCVKIRFIFPRVINNSAINVSSSFSFSLLENDVPPTK